MLRFQEVKYPAVGHFLNLVDGLKEVFDDNNNNNNNNNIIYTLLIPQAKLQYFHSVIRIHSTHRPEIHTRAQYLYMH